MTSTVPITVAVVDDDAEFRSLVRDTLGRTEGVRVVADCPDGETAVAELPDLRPNVVLMDIQMTGMSGIECVRSLKAAMPEVQYMMLTVFEDYDRIFESLKAGATGYLIKKGVASRLAEAVRDLHAGQSPISPTIARRLIQTLPLAPPLVDSLEQLSPRERQILEGLARGRQYKEIADELGVSFNTVRTHIGRIYQKLHVHSRTEAVRHSGFGFRRHF